jgi:hypothetical protein
MPITYNAAEDIWNLTDPTEAEVSALTRIALGEITAFFGEEMASRIVEEAAQSRMAKSAKVVPVATQVAEASADAFEADGQVGQA